MPTYFGRMARKKQIENGTAISRRDLIKATLAASAGMLLSNCSGWGLGGTIHAKDNGRRIVVIGAGFSGLACAYELASAGYRVEVLEARGRVGGRVLSFDDMVPGKIVEGGGELIGTNHPTWMQYAEKFKLPLRAIPEDTLIEPLQLEGRVLSKDENEAIYKEMEKAFATLTDAARVVNEEEPWLTPGAAQMDAMTMGQWLMSLDASPLAKKAIRAEIEGNESVAMERQSYLAFLTMVKGGGCEKYWTDSENMRCAQGNQALAFELAKALGKRVRLGTAVVSIIHGSQAMVTTADGRRITCDDVVLTVPPSAWKTMKFVPELPEEWKVQMGTAVKYLSGLKGRYWKKLEGGTISPMCLTDGDCSMTWEGTDGQGSDDSGADLTIYSGGPAAEHLRARDVEDRKAYCANQMEQIYPGYKENLVATRFMDWPADPWLNATFSFSGAGQITTIGPKLWKGTESIRFAGEYTCFKFPGYMEGGLNSGVTAARRIAQRDGIA